MKTRFVAIVLLLGLHAISYGQTNEAKTEAKFPIQRAWGKIQAVADGLEVHLKKAPESGRITIPRLNNPVGKIVVRGAKTEWSIKPGLKTWDLIPPKRQKLSVPCVIHVATIGKPRLPSKQHVVAAADGKAIVLAAHDAITHGRLLRYEPQPHKNTVGYWADEKDWCEWRFQTSAPGEYELHIQQGCGKGQGGSSVAIEVGGQTVSFTVEDTGHFQNFKWRKIGSLKLASKGPHTLRIRVKKKAANAVMDVRSVKLIPAEAAASRRAKKRPNIVFCFADDWGRYASAYRKPNDRTPNAIVKTPNFDRIAKEGVLFNNAFVNAPSCTPCRSSLLSGQYFFRTGRGAILQGAIWDLKIPSYPLLLRDAGYHIGHTYKVWTPGSPAHAPYGGVKLGYNKAGASFNRFSQTVSRAEDQQKAIEGLLDEVRGNFRMFLEDRKQNQPFCYWFGPTNCHRKWTQGSGKQIWGLDPNDLKGRMPAFLPDEPIVREDLCDYLGEVQAFDAGVGVILKELERIGELDETLVVVSGDHGAPGFPNGKCNLYDFGVQVALAVRWGRNIPTGRTVDDFVNLPDLAPTFLDVAGVKKPEVMTARSLTTVLRSHKQGLVDPTRDAVVVGRERHVALARAGAMPYPQRAIRTKDFLYIRNFKPERWPMGMGPGYGLPQGEMPGFEIVRENTFACFGDLDASPTKAWLIANRDKPGVDNYFKFAFGRRPAEELFDLSKDPDQVNNVAGDKGYAEAKRSLSSRLMRVLKDANFPLWVAGHLGLADNGFAARFRPDCSSKPEGWEELFWFGSELKSDRSVYPAPDEVLAYLRDRRTVLMSVIEELTEDEWNAPAPGPDEPSPIAGAPNLGHLLLFAAFHEGVHAGQLTIAHRCLGNPPIVSP